MGTFNINAFISQQEQLKQIELDLLIPYHNHKFKLYDGERLDDMVQSIKENGVLTPIIVRSVSDGSGKYEILAGHNRCNAAKLAGLTTVPGVIKGQLTDDEAEMYVIETNLMQRGFDDLSISEQAAVVAQRHSAMFDKNKIDAIHKELELFQQGIDDDDLGNAVFKPNSKCESKLVTVGKVYGLSKNSIARLIRINTLYDDIKLSVDLRLLSVRAGVELSYISLNIQKTIFEYYKEFVLHKNVWCDIIRIDMITAMALRHMFENFSGTDAEARALLVNYNSKKFPVEQPKKNDKPIKISMQPDLYQKYFNEDVKPKEVADTIEKALQMYFAQTQNL